MLTLQRASHLLAFALTTTFMSVVFAASADLQVVEPPRLWSLATKVVNPEYPVAARRSRLHGHGLLVGDVNFNTGDVRSVRMEKTTGSTILDQAALTAFGQWKFKPRSIRKFRTPINFTIRNASNQTMERTAGSFGRSLSMKLHPQPAATRHPASRRSSC